MALTLAQLQNKVLHLLQEGTQNAVPTTTPTSGTDFGNAYLTMDLNQAIQRFIDDSGVAPGISEKLVTSTIVAGLDYTLPADLESLVRVEYKVAGQQPLALPQKTFDEFDVLTAGGLSLANVGAPQFYREPFGTNPNQTIRFNPQPNAANASAGDTISLYYGSLGTTLVLAADTPGIPSQYHEAPAFYVLSKYWRRKSDAAQADMYMRDYLNLVRAAKAFADNRSRGEQPSFEDEESIEGSIFYGQYR